MLDWLLARKAATPAKAALISKGQTLSFTDLHELVERVRIYLQSTTDIERGQRVALLLPNSVQYVAMMLALMRMRVVIVPLNTRLTITELRWQLDNADCRYLVYSEATTEQATRLTGADFRIKLMSVENILAEESNQQSEASFQPRHALNEIDLDAPLAIIHTSGTSGRPKGAVLSYGNVFYSAMASAYRLGHRPTDCWLSVLPLYHVGGLSIIMRAVLYGITVDLREHFDVTEINDALQNNITLVSLVPTMLYRLLEQGTPEKWSTIRLILLGGAAASSELLKRCQDFGLPVALTYGLTEAASQVATMLPQDALCKAGSVGKPLLFTRIQVVDEAGEAVSPGTYGEIIVSGPTVMQGYYGDAEATGKVLRDGWLHTGDIGYLDDDGDLWLVQRRSDLIVTGGENVYPAEVEAVLRQHPAIAQVAVAGVEHPEWGQQVGAVVVLQKPATAREIIDYSRQHLSSYKIPRRMCFVEQIPQTASGKIHADQIRRLLAKGASEF